MVIYSLVPAITLGLKLKFLLPLFSQFYLIFYYLKKIRDKNQWKNVNFRQIHDYSTRYFIRNRIHIANADPHPAQGIRCFKKELTDGFPR
jgi:hypothetical protein